jgi:hypothetical protein
MCDHISTNCQAYPVPPVWLGASHVFIFVQKVYHICDNGVHSVHTCEDELYFNPHTGLCDWPINVNCTALNKKQFKDDRKYISTCLSCSRAAGKCLFFSKKLSQPVRLQVKYSIFRHPKILKVKIYARSMITDTGHIQMIVASIFTVRMVLQKYSAARVACSGNRVMVIVYGHWILIVSACLGSVTSRTNWIIEFVFKAKQASIFQIFCQQLAMASASHHSVRIIIIVSSPHMWPHWKTFITVSNADLTWMASIRTLLTAMFIIFAMLARIRLFCVNLVFISMRKKMFAIGPATSNVST